MAVISDKAQFLTKLGGGLPETSQRAKICAKSREKCMEQLVSGRV